MGERFIVVFKNGERLTCNYPKDSVNPFKARKISQATIGNVIAIEGPGHIAQTLRKRYGLTEEDSLSDLGIIQETTGMTKENILKQKDKIQARLEKLRRKHILSMFLLFVLVCFSFSFLEKIPSAYATVTITVPVPTQADTLSIWAGQDDKFVYLNYHWYFFYQDSSIGDIYVADAGDNLVWTRTAVMTGTNSFDQLCVATNQTHIGITYFEGTANDYYFKIAKVNADHTLTWSSAVRLCDGKTYQAQRMALYYGGGYWWCASGTDSNAGNYIFYLWYSTNGVSWTQTQIKTWESAFHCRYATSMFVSYTTITRTIFMYISYTEASPYYRIWDGSLGTEQTLVLTHAMAISTIKDSYCSLAISKIAGNEYLYFVWRASDNKLYYKQYNGSWSADIAMDASATCQGPTVGFDSVSLQTHFNWERSGAIYDRVIYSNGTLASATTPFTGYTNTPSHLVSATSAPYFALGWRDNDKTIKLGIINSPTAQIFITFQKTNAGVFYVNGADIANNTVLDWANSTSIILIGIPNSGYTWNNFSFGATAYTTNIYTYALHNNGTMKCWFTLPGTPTPYVTARFRFIPTNETIYHNVSFTDKSVSSSAISSYLWSFGDAGSSALQNPTHNYTSIATRNVTLTVTSSVGSNTAWQLLNITAPSGAPDYTGYMPVDQARAIMFGSVLLIAVILIPAILLLRRR